MPAFDMPAAPASFEERGGWVCRRLAAEFSLTFGQAAGFPGNLGFESDGFEKLHEVGQPEGVGGYGWGQWTASRRVAFLSYCQERKLDWRSDEANYGYLVRELRGAYHDTIAAVMRCATVEQSTWIVGQTYERPAGTTPTNLPGYEERLSYARRALAGAKAAPAGNAASPAATPPARGGIADVQRALNAAGIEPPLVLDGLFGPDTRDALIAYQTDRGMPRTGVPDAATKAALGVAADDNDAPGA